MRLRYRGLHQQIVIEEDENHKLVLGQWRDVNLQDMEEVTGGHRDTKMA